MDANRTNSGPQGFRALLRWFFKPPPQPPRFQQYRVEVVFSGKKWGWVGEAASHAHAQQKATRVIDPQIDRWLKRGF